MARRLATIFLATSLILIAPHGGCGSRPKSKEVHAGMTIKQVEDVLGEPITVAGGVSPTREFRSYQPEGSDRIVVTFEEGIAKDIQKAKPNRPAIE